MFDFDSFREILATMRRNKMRTFLTGFAVAWGIFMLIILLASGNGLKNGVMENFASRARNAVMIGSGWTSMPHKGMPTGRRIRFDERDLNMLREQLPEIEYLSGNIGTTVTMSQGNEYATVWVQGMTSDGAYINNLTLHEGQGRLLNKVDDEYRRKVIVLHPDHVKVLFKDEDPIGKYVIANKIPYQVIGIYHTEDRNDTQPSAYIPLSVAQILYNRGWGYWNIEFTVNGLTTLEANEAFNQKVREKMARFHSFDPADRSAMWMWSTAEDAVQTEKIFAILNIFLVIIGIASLLAGIVGVGNIMLITVKERTREIGIRKSLGARPSSVLWLVIFEAIFITTFAGYIGIVLGVGLTELVSLKLAESANEGMTIFTDPTVDIGTVAGATLFLIVCGVIAGLIPAWRATRISPIEAMRAE